MHSQQLLRPVCQKHSPKEFWNPFSGVTSAQGQMIFSFPNFTLMPRFSPRSQNSGWGQCEPGKVTSFTWSSGRRDTPNTSREDQDSSYLHSVPPPASLSTKPSLTTPRLQGAHPLL